MNDDAEVNRPELPEVRTESSGAAEAERSAFALHRDSLHPVATNNTGKTGKKQAPRGGVRLGATGRWMPREDSNLDRRNQNP